MKKSGLISLITACLFLGSIALFSACSGSKKGQTRVHSGSGMGNKGHKNKHVWGK